MAGKVEIALILSMSDQLEPDKCDDMQTYVFVKQKILVFRMSDTE